MVRRIAIPILLVIAIGLGYFAVVSPTSSGTIHLDIAFVGSVLAFLVLLVIELGNQLQRTSAEHDTVDSGQERGRTYNSSRNQSSATRSVCHHSSS